MSEPSPLQWLQKTVRIATDGVYFGDCKMPGCIAQEGVKVVPGGGNDINKLTVTFLVGDVTVEDPTKVDK